MNGIGIEQEGNSGVRLAKLLILLLSLTFAIGNPGRAPAEIRLNSGVVPGARVALVIGNSAYQNAETLANPETDAIAIGAALERIGFEVDLRTDLDRLGMQHAVRDFGLRAEAADVALVFYAGHGVQVASENYLLPVDAALERERDLLYKALPLDLVIGEVARAQRLNLVILDASRASRFTERLRRMFGPSRAQLVVDGLGRIADLPSETVVALASRPAHVASDGAGDHSPFTAALLQHLEEPGVDHELMLRKVRASVLAATDNRQLPTYYRALSDAAPYVLSPVQAARPDRAALPAELAPAALPREPALEALLAARAPAEPTAAPTLAEPEALAAIGDYETIRASNIRRGPSAETERVTTVAAGTPVRVIARAEGRNWYEVETANGLRGFIYGELIRLKPASAPPAERSQVAPAPRVVEQAVAPVTTAALLARSDDGALVRVFYGTDRVNAGSAAAPRFSGERARQLSLGTVVVRIPPEHQLGRVERPWSFNVFGQSIVDLPEDPERHFTIYRIAVSDGERFVDDLRQVVGVSRSYQHQAFVFIHGYNVSFEAAAFRTAQIAHDLNFDGAPIFYSWPSRGDLTDYEYDQNSASQARPFLREFLELVRRRSGADVVHVIAHSMGTGPLLEVLAELKGANDAAATTPLFNEIVLAAPDIDVDVFYYLAKRVQGVAKGITMYVSSADRAMQAAREYARGVPRAGDVPQTGPVIEFGIDTIDATAISTGFFGLNHSDYAENRILLNDIGLLLRAGLRPPSARNLTLVRVQVQDGYYWKYPD